MNIRDRIIHGENLSVDYTDAWLELLEELDITDDTITELRDHRAEIDRLNAVATELAHTSPSAPPAVPKLDRHATASDALDAARRAERTTADELDAARKAVENQVAAVTRAYTRGFDRYTRAWLLLALTPHHDRLAKRAIHLAKKMPDGLATDKDAAYGGMAAEWAELSDVLTRLSELRTLVDNLRANGYLATGGARPAHRYHPEEFSYRDVETALDYLAWNSRVGHARALQHAQPALLRVQDIDDIRRSEPNTPVRDEAAYYARIARQKAVDDWTAAGRRAEELARFRAEEQHQAALSKARMAHA